MFRTNIPIRAVKHDFHAAADGQLGGIIKSIVIGESVGIPTG